jgi:hypothetical protein
VTVVVELLVMQPLIRALMVPAAPAQGQQHGVPATTDEFGF